MCDILLLCSDIHVTDADAQAESGLTVADRRLLFGALEYKDKRCVPGTSDVLDLLLQDT